MRRKLSKEIVPDFNRVDIDTVGSILELTQCLSRCRDLPFGIISIG